MHVCLIIRYYMYINDRSTPLPGTSGNSKQAFCLIDFKVP